MIVVWLDDERDPADPAWAADVACPPGASVVWLTSVAAFTTWMSTHHADVVRVCFDNDLGGSTPAEEGRAAFAWLEERCHLDGWGPFSLHVQSSNGPAAGSMRQGISALRRFWSAYATNTESEP